MPFKSEAQRRWMYANHPEMAKEWEADTPKGPLPARIKPIPKGRKRAGEALSAKAKELGIKGFD